MTSLSEIEEFLGSDLYERVEKAGLDPEYVMQIYHHRGLPKQKFLERLKNKLHIVEPISAHEENLRDQLEVLGDIKKGVLRDAIQEDKNVPDLEEILNE